MGLFGGGNAKSEVSSTTATNDQRMDIGMGSFGLSAGRALSNVNFGTSPLSGIKTGAGNVSYNEAGSFNLTNAKNTTIAGGSIFNNTVKTGKASTVNITNGIDNQALGTILTGNANNISQMLANQIDNTKLDIIAATSQTKGASLEDVNAAIKSIGSSFTTQTVSGGVSAGEVKSIIGSSLGGLGEAISGTMNGLVSSMNDLVSGLGSLGGGQGSNAGNNAEIINETKKDAEKPAINWLLIGGLGIGAWFLLKGSK